MMVEEAMPFYKLWVEIEQNYTSGDGYLDKLCMELVGLDSSRCRPPTRDVRERYREEARRMLIATGVPGVWSDAIESVRPGGLVNLFGGCAPGTSIPLDTHLVHYSELTIKGVYHHRPDTFRRAIALLADPGFKADALLSGVRPIEGVVDALQAMIRKEALKVVIRNGA